MIPRTVPASCRSSNRPPVLADGQVAAFGPRDAVRRQLQDPQRAAAAPATSPVANPAVNPVTVQASGTVPVPLAALRPPGGRERPRACSNAAPTGRSAALLGDDRDLRRLGYGILLVVFGGFGGWAALAPLDSAAVAPGVITVQNYRRTVQHLEGGIVQALHVREGQFVKAGEALIDLEGTQFRAELDSLGVQQATLRAQEARLLAERDRRAVVTYPGADVLLATDPRVIEARRRGSRRSSPRAAAPTRARSPYCARAATSCARRSPASNRCRPASVR